MIEVIKHGQKKFKAICTNCGCEFTYELSDMKPLGGVDCPDCGAGDIYLHSVDVYGVRRSNGRAEHLVDKTSKGE